MNTLLENIAELINMIFATIVTPNYGASNTAFSIFRHLLGTQEVVFAEAVRGVLLLTFGIGIAGVSIGLLKRLLCRN